MTDRNPREAPSFRTGLGAPPLILVVQLAGVHGNKGIIINKGLRVPAPSSHSEEPGWAAAAPGGGRCSHPPCAETRAHVPWVGPGSGSSLGLRGQEGAVGAVPAARRSHVARWDLSSFTSSRQRGHTPRSSQRTANGARGARLIT